MLLTLAITLPLLFLQPVLTISESVSDISYPAGKCALKNQFLDLTSLTCAACNSIDPNYEYVTLPSAASSPSLYSAKSSCICKYGYYSSGLIQVGTGTGSDARFQSGCLACPSGTNSSIDRTFCLYCGKSAQISPSTGMCACKDPSLILVDRDAGGSPLNETLCKACDPNSYPSTNRQYCVSCPDPLMTAKMLPNNQSFACTCPDSYTVNNQIGRCIYSPALSAVSSSYPSSQVTSLTYYVCKLMFLFMENLTLRNNNLECYFKLIAYKSNLCNRQFRVL